MTAVTRRLMVIVPDRISSLAEKGEITARYYNPGDLFDEVHLVLVNDDRPDPAIVQPTVGRARLTLHNLPDPRALLFVATLGWRPILLRLWARRAVRLAERIRPDLVRCHAPQLNAFAASEIKRCLGIPYVVSLHINPDADRRAPIRDLRSLAHAVIRRARDAHAQIAMRNADAVVCAYEFLQPYAARSGAPKIDIIYNVVSPDHVPIKEEYRLGDPPRLIVVGRQIPDKDPRPVLDAVARIDGLHATIVGNGILHDEVRAQATRLGLGERVAFHTSIGNEELMQTVGEHDLLVSVNDYGGVSKVELEAAFVGLPVVTNAHPDEDLPEVLGKNCLVADGSVDGYERAIRRFLEDEDLRRTMGQGLRDSVAPLRHEELRLASLYREIVGS